MGQVPSRPMGSVKCKVRWNPIGRGQTRIRLVWPLCMRYREGATLKLKLVLAGSGASSHGGPSPKPGGRWRGVRASYGAHPQVHAPELRQVCPSQGWTTPF